MGTRLGCAGPKALVSLEGESLLTRTLRRFGGLADNAIVICPPEHEALFQAHLNENFSKLAITLVPGGAERQDSVERGLAVLDSDTEVVMIHDAARPFISMKSIEAALDAAHTIGAATVAVPVIDTILHGFDEDFLETTPNRKQLWACQTPQVFQVHLIRDAHGWARREKFGATDDATLVRRMGHPVKLIHGTYTNIKITTPEDMIVAAAFIREGIV